MLKRFWTDKQLLRLFLTFFCTSFIQLITLRLFNAVDKGSFAILLCYAISFNKGLVLGLCFLRWGNHIIYKFAVHLILSVLQINVDMFMRLVRIIPLRSFSHAQLLAL